MRVHELTQSVPVVLITVAALSGGCAIRTPCASDRGSPTDPRTLAWPDRAAPDWIQPGSTPRVEHRRRHIAVLVENGLVPGVFEDDVRVLYERALPGTFVCEEVHLDPKTKEPSPGADPVIRCVMVEPGVTEPGEHPGLRTAEFQILPPLAGEPSGIVFMLQSLTGSDQEIRVRDALRRRGWAVAFGSVPWGIISPRTIDAKSDDDLARAAAETAALNDARMANWALAARTTLDHTRAQHPDWPTARVVVLGCSAGALCAPTVAARLFPDVSAVVIVGGGANLMNISRRTTLDFHEFRILWQGGPIPPHKAGVLDAAYLERSALDPCHTAPVLRAVPTLEIRGIFDDIVPADAADVLHQRLGRPERWSLPGGHKFLFWRLPLYADDIGDWLDRATASTR